MSTAPNVTIIPAKVQTAESRDKYHQLRVAAYCRVSTAQEEQQNSYQVQIAYYTDLINRKKEWKFCTGRIGIHKQKRKLGQRKSLL